MDFSTLFKRAACGAIGGVAGLVAMRLYWKGASAVMGEDPRMLTNEGPPHELDTMSATGGMHTQEGESSTAAVGRIGKEEVTGRPPQSEEEKTRLSYGVHWSYGIAAAKTYAIARGRQDGLDATGGLAFGTLLWTLGDELMVPLLGLSKGPTAYPIAQHAHRFGAHMAFGLTVAAAAQALLHVVEPAPKPREVAWKAAKTYAKYKVAKAGAKGAKKAIDKVRG